MAIADILAEKEELEQKYLEKIVKLSHADQVLGLLGQWLYDFEYFPDWYDFYRAVYDRYEDGATVEVVYGQRLSMVRLMVIVFILPRIGKKSLLMIMMTILGTLPMMRLRFMK